MAEKNSFIMYQADGAFFELLDEKDCKSLIMAIFAYSRGEETEMTDKAAIAFKSIKEHMDINQEKYEATREKRRKAVQKRWEKKTEKENTKEYKCNTSVIQNDSVNVNDNVNVNVNDNVNVNVNEKVNEKENENVFEKVSETEYENVKLTDDELDILYGLTDRPTVENYISKIRSWQVANRKINTKPYISIRRWMDQDHVIKEKPRDQGISVEDYLAYAASIDYDTLTY